MGYFVSYKMEVNTGNYSIGEIAKAIRCEDVFCDLGIEKPSSTLCKNNKIGKFSLRSTTEVRWRDRKADIAKFSKEYPNATLFISGRGEDNEKFEYKCCNGDIKERHTIICWSEWS